MSLTSLQGATALCRGVNHLLSLALTLAPVKQMQMRSINNEVKHHGTNYYKML